MTLHFTNVFEKYLKKIIFFKLICFLIFSDHFNILMLKIIFKKYKKFYFKIKYILKNYHYRNNHSSSISHHDQWEPKVTPISSLFFQYLLLFHFSTCLVTIDLFLFHYFNIKSRDPFVLDVGSSLHLSRRRELHRRTKGRKETRASTC